jgi:short-subunit dehydrogenase
MKTTLITGASSGIGEVFARKLAAQRHNLVLVARSEQRLADLCNELGRDHTIHCQFIVADLTDPSAPRNLFAETEKRELEVDFLINNAGYGSSGEFIEQDLDKELQMIDLNVKALVALTYLYLKPMRERGTGSIINVASTAGFQAVPYMTTYAATKAFVLSFSDALWEENRAHGVKVIALCPGVTDTNFFAASEMERPPMRIAQTPEQVVDVALKGLKKGRGHIVSGWPNYLMVEAERLVPRSLTAKVAGRAMRPKHGAK